MKEKKKFCIGSATRLKQKSRNVRVKQSEHAFNTYGHFLGLKTLNIYHPPARAQFSFESRNNSRDAGIASIETRLKQIVRAVEAIREQLFLGARSR